MNKTKKIAMVAVSCIMAGTMALSVTACGGGSGGSSSGSEKLSVKTDENGKLSYTSGITLNMNVGNQNSTTPQSISYKSFELASSVTMPDGKTYNSGDLKPVWSELKSTLNINFTDKFQNRGTDAQITTAISQKEMANYDIITASASAMVENSSYLVNLNDYLDYMPNYKAFLEANPVVKYSLTSNTSTGAMYYAPYFDGNDDIEKYELAQQAWIRKILDDTTSATTGTITFKAQAKSKISGTTVGISSSATSYMGTTGADNWQVETTKPTAKADGSDGTFYVAVRYDETLKDALDITSEGSLGKILKEILSTNANSKDSYTDDWFDASNEKCIVKSGNIVDIMNIAINQTKGEVTGVQLIQLLQRYIAKAYYYGEDAKAASTSSNALYGQTVNGVTTKLSDVFNSEFAAWDVDLMTAISRCAVTAGAIIGASTEDQYQTVFGLAARQGTTQRRVDITALAGELYGVRGMESRYEYTYIDANGDIQDARLNADSYTLVAKLSGLADEGLLYTGTLKADETRKFVADTSYGCSPLFMHDYSQTQTTKGFTLTDTTTFDLSPVNTPVSKWDVDGDSTNGHETVMRFTESWRSVKNSGFCISKEAVKNNPDKLSACLAFIDYVFSNDGQILMTYGPQSTNGNNDYKSETKVYANGWWYGTDVSSSVQLSTVADLVADATTYCDAQYQIKEDYKSLYFIYKGKVYTGTSYNGTQVPTVTDVNKALFLGEEVTVNASGAKVQQNVSTALAVKAIGSYTDYARKVIGSTLPLGNKNQGYEYQATAPCALAGTSRIAISLLNGTIKHVKLSVSKTEDGDNYKWYMIAPTSIALTSAQQSTLKKDSAQTVISGKLFLNSSSTDVTDSNAFIDLAMYGFNTKRYIAGLESNGKIPKDGSSFVTLVQDSGMTKRMSIITDCWNRTKAYFNIWSTTVSD
jgi:putative aldouronate transport system substrate-binding protein